MYGGGDKERVWIMEGVNPGRAGERLPGGRVRLINEIRRAGAVASWDSQLKLRPDP